MDLTRLKAYNDACRRTADTALRVLARAGHLAPRRAVLHAPPGDPGAQRRMLTVFIETWRRRCSVPLLLENTEACDVLSLGEDFLFARGAGFCLDVAHAMGYAQIELLRSGLPARADVIHWSAPGNGDAHAALDACEALGIPHKNIRALQGPFTREMNKAMLTQYNVKWLVTKDGGKAGGFTDKADAAREKHVPLVLIRRPQEDGQTMEEILHELGEEKGKCK